MKGAFERWTVPQHGYCTFINVVAGAHLVFIGKKKSQQLDNLTDEANAMAAFEPYGVNGDLWNVDAVVVQAGCQL